MPVSWDSAKKQYRYRFRRKIGGRRIVCTKLLQKGWSRDQAESYGREKDIALSAQASGVDEKAPLIATAVAHYLTDVVPKRRDGKKAAQELARLHDYWNGLTWTELPDIAERYAKDFAHLAPATICKRLAYLRAACRYAWKHRRLGDRRYSPGEAMNLPTPDNERHVYHSAQELALLWSKIGDDSTRALFQLAFYTGTRWREGILKRKPEDILRDQSGVWLRLPPLKNGKRRWVPVVPEAEALLKYIPFRFCHTYYWSRFRKALSAAGLEGAVPHDLRHSLASAILSGSGNLSDVAEALGHKSLGSSKRYAHMYPTHLRGVMTRVVSQLNGISPEPSPTAPALPAAQVIDIKVKRTA